MQHLIIKIITRNPKVIWEELHCHPSRQRMDSPAACAMPTADEYNHSTDSTQHSHHRSTSMHAIPHNYTTKSPLVTMGCPTFTPKLPFLLRWSPPHLIYPSLDWSHSPPQTASRSNNPFFHNSPTNRQTDPTDGLRDNSVPSPTYALLYWQTAMRLIIKHDIRVSTT